MLDQAPPIFSHRWRMLAIAILAMIAIAVFKNAIKPWGMDFISFWAASKLSLMGNLPGAYDVVLHRSIEAQASTFDGQMPFPYPPPFFFLIWPFGALPYPLAAAIWIGLSLGAYFYAVKRNLPGFETLALALPPILLCGMVGQNGLFTAALLIAAMGQIKERPFVAGLMFGCLAMKPQIAVLIPLALIAAREWKAFAGAAVSAVSLSLASLAVFGWPAWQGFFDILPLYGQLTAGGQVGWYKIATVFASLRMVGIPALPAALVHGAVALAGVWIVWRVWSRQSDPLFRTAALVTATMLTSPYMYMYDQPMLIAGVAWAVTRGLNEKGLAILYAASFYCFAQMLSETRLINLMPVMPIGLLMMLYRESGETARLTALWQGLRMRAGLAR
jgi:hypothetical protein